MLAPLVAQMRANPWNCILLSIFPQMTIVGKIRIGFTNLFSLPSCPTFRGLIVAQLLSHSLDQCQFISGDSTEERNAMTVVGNKQPTATSPEDPVRAALEDAGLRDRLVNQARAILHRRKDLTGIEIDDVVQKTLTRAMEGQKRFDNNKRPVGAWLHGVLVNVVREEIRAALRQPRQQPADSDVWAESAVAPFPQEDTTPVQTSVEQHLSLLSPNDQAVVRMRFLDELSLQDIAVRLNIGYVAVRMRFSRAMKRLQEQSRNLEERP
jgi:RNA polymerase sigma factor (sigma-70 family)